MNRGFDQQQSRWLLHGDLSCLECGYNLRGLVGPQVLCPECGHVNDLTDPTPWRASSLPLGVRDRQHWPASASALSMLFPIALGPTAIAFDEGSPAVFLVLLGVSIGIAVGWWLTCRRWIRSCISAGWGLLVLFALHASVWLLLSGVYGAIYFLVERSAWHLLGIGPLGLAGFGWVYFVLRDQPGASQYREDWRTWQLPVGVTGRSNDDVDSWSSPQSE